MADALNITEGSNSYIKFTTTDSSEKITVSKDTDFVGNISGSTIEGQILTADVFLSAPSASITNLTNTNITASGHISGSLTSTLEIGGHATIGAITASSYTGSFVGDGSNLTGVGQDIDTLDAFSGVPHATDDEFLISDDGTEKRATMTMVANGGFALVSGDATIAAGGALTIGAGTVEHGMLNDNIISGQGAMTAVAQADLLMIDDGPGTVKKITFSNFEDEIFGNVSGDATIAGGGALTIGDNKIGNDELKQDDDITLQSLTTTNNVTVGGDLVVNGTTTVSYTHLRAHET